MVIYFAVLAQKNLTQMNAATSPSARITVNGPGLVTTIRTEKRKSSMMNTLASADFDILAPSLMAAGDYFVGLFENIGLA